MVLQAVRTISISKWMSPKCQSKNEFWMIKNEVFCRWILYSEHIESCPGRKEGSALKWIRNTEYEIRKYTWYRSFHWKPFSPFTAVQIGFWEAWAQREVATSETDSNVLIGLTQNKKILNVHRSNLLIGLTQNIWLKYKIFKPWRRIVILVLLNPMQSR